MEANQTHYTHVAEFTARFVGALERAGKPLMPRGFGLNINYPPGKSVKKAVIAKQGQTSLVAGKPVFIAYQCETDCAGAEKGDTVPAGLKFLPVSLSEAGDADTTLNLAGNITIVPIESDYTADTTGTADSTAKRFSKTLENIITSMGY